MLSPSAAVDEIDRTVTPAQEIPIRRQKRTFTTDSISDPWVERQRETLLKLKHGMRVVSPRTMVFIDTMVNQCNTALSEPFKTEYFEELVEGLQNEIAFLEARLENDDKYAKELESFTALGTEDVLLKYGGYYAEGCNTIRSMAVGDDKVLLQGRRWKEILEEFDNEEKAMMEYREHGHVGLIPVTPVTALIGKIALLWKDFDRIELVAMIRCYADRNGLVHNGVNEYIRKRAWAKLAVLLRRDYHNINTYYPQLKDQERVELLQKTIESCQKKFFAWIKEEGEGRDLCVVSWKLRDEIAAEDDKIYAAQLKAKEDAEYASKMKSSVLGDAEPLTEVQIAELKDAQNVYQALMKERDEVEKSFKKQKLEIAATREDFQKKFAEANSRLEKAEKGEE